MGEATSVDSAELLKKQAHISVQRYFEISLLLMLGTSFFTLATTGKLDFPSVTIVSAALLLKLWSYIREADYSLAPRTVTRIAIFYIFFYALDFLIFSAGPTLMDRTLEATVHLILFATVIKVFSARTYRDYGYLATLSFMMMLAGAILTVGTIYLVCFTLYVLCSISTFISYEIKRSAEAARRAPEGPFRTPAENRTAIEMALVNSTVGLATGIVILGSVLFFVIPRYRTGYLTGLAMERQNITGFSEKVDFGDIRKILRSNTVVMRVVVEGNPRSYQGIKWRGVGLTSFDGQHWFNDNTEQTPISPASVQDTAGQLRRFVLPRPHGWQSRPRDERSYRVVLSSLSTDVLFAAAVPRELTGHFRLINTDQTESLHNPLHGYTAVSYEVISETGLPSARELRQASSDYPPEIRLIYLRLPLEDARIADLATKVTASTANNYDRALALESYLRRNFAYTLDPPAIEPDDPIGSFLFKSKAGYCEYFAAAMVWMLRTIGIPSRLVNGFQTGTYNRLGKDFIVRARDAHSWVEAYFPEYGWIPFDPTPADPNPVTAGEWGPFDDYVDALSLFWSEWIINYDFVHQVQLARQLEQDSRQFQFELQKRVRNMQRKGVELATRVEGWLMSHKLLVLLLMAAILALLIGSEKTGSLAELRFLLAWKFRRRDRALTVEEATLTYSRFLKVLGKKGFMKLPAQTPREFAFSFAGSPLHWPVLEFTRLYNALRFGQARISLSSLRDMLERIASGKQ